MIPGIRIFAVPTTDGRFIGKVKTTKIGKELYSGNAFADLADAIREAEAWVTENQHTIPKIIRFH